MTALLTTHRLVLLRAALVEYLGELERRHRIFCEYLQGQSTSSAAVLLGDEINAARGMLDDIECLLAQATGQPHAANMAAIASLAYNARLRRQVSAYEAPDEQGGAA